MFADRLRKSWIARRQSRAIDSVMRFGEEGLVIGAGTVLAKSIASSRHVSIDVSDARLQALLATAHLSVPTTAALAHLGKAVERWNDGEEVLAAMHLALSRLERLAEPETDAHRLFLAESLLKDGIEADVIVGVIAAGYPIFGQFRKYSPDQARVPAGSGRTSGQWTTGGWGAAVGLSPDAQAIPSTFIAGGERIQKPYACKLAHMDCTDAALNAAHVHDEVANDNMPRKDLENCTYANTACDVLSLAIKYVPLLDYGGVIFPHRGVVIFRKGQVDTYYRPLSGGRAPPFSRRP